MKHKCICGREGREEACMARETVGRLFQPDPLMKMYKPCSDGNQGEAEVVMCVQFIPSSVADKIQELAISAIPVQSSQR